MSKCFRFRGEGEERKKMDSLDGVEFLYVDDKKRAIDQDVYALHCPELILRFGSWRPLTMTL